MYVNLDTILSIDLVEKYCFSGKAISDNKTNKSITPHSIPIPPIEQNRPKTSYFSSKDQLHNLTYICNYALF